MHWKESYLLTFRDYRGLSKRKTLEELESYRFHTDLTHLQPIAINPRMNSGLKIIKLLSTILVLLTQSCPIGKKGLFWYSVLIGWVFFSSMNTSAIYAHSKSLWTKFMSKLVFTQMLAGLFSKITQSDF